MRLAQPDVVIDDFDKLCSLEIEVTVAAELRN